MTDTPDDEILTGGNMNSVVRRGDAVIRMAGAWTPTIHRLLDHLRVRGVDWLPRPLGLETGPDDRARERLTFLPGSVPGYPLPAWVWTRDLLLDVGDRLARIHAASRDFDRSGAIWQLPAHEPDEVICLNDVAPYNMVFDDAGRLTGMIDVDTASPGPRVWDLAYLAYRVVPLGVSEDTGAGELDGAERDERLQVLCDAYAAAGDRVAVAPLAVLRCAVDRLEDLADFTAARVAEAPQVAPHVEIYRRDAAWLRDTLP